MIQAFQLLDLKFSCNLLQTREMCNTQLIYATFFFQFISAILYQLNLARVNYCVNLGETEV